MTVTTTATYERTLNELRDRVHWSNGPLSLISFTIAGVQDFLAAARTTRDVWNGSYLLSYLAYRATRAMLEQIQEQTGKSKLADVFGWVLMPHVDSQPLMQREAGLKIAGDLRIANFPNSILLLYPGDWQKASEVAAGAEKELDKAWRAIVQAAQQAWAKQGLMRTSYTLQQWDYQVARNRALEVYWTAVQIPEKKEDFLSRFLPYAGGKEPENWYGALIQWSGYLLNSRKMLRDFEQIGQEGNRCSLCGARTALADYEVPKRPQRGWRSDPVRHSHGRLVAFWQRACRKFQYRFRPTERLCAVCVVRRLAPLEYFGPKVFRTSDSAAPSDPEQKVEFSATEPPEGASEGASAGESRGRIEFPSTSTIAAAHAVAKLIDAAESQSNVQAVLAEFLSNLQRDIQKCSRAPRIFGPLLPHFESLPEGPLRDFAACDGDWFYEDHYNPASLEREYGLEPGEAESAFRVNRAWELKQALGKLGVDFQPSNYLAVIRADGDHMGEWVCGRMQPKSYSPIWQAKLSEALAEFSRGLQSRLEKDLPGKVVYAGGDDVLAFVPRESTLKALEQIEDAFSTSVGKHAPEMTLSMACVLARYNDPLSYSLERSEKLLKDHAKEACGRNAIAIERTTGGGEITGFQIWTPSYRLLKLVRQLHDHMQAMVGKSRTGLSARIVNQLEELREGLEEWPGAEAELLQARLEMLKYAVLRHFHPKPGDEKARAQEVQSAQKLLCDLYLGLVEAQSFRRAGRPGAARDGKLDPFDQLLRLLSMLRFLTREGR